MFLAWEGAGGVWARSFFRTADDVALELILDLFGRVRQQARASTATIVAIGTDGTVVPAGFVAATPDGVRFASAEAATIGDGDAVWAVRIESAINATLYRLTVDGTDYDYTSDGSASYAEIRNGLAGEIDGNDGLSARAVVDADGISYVIVRASGPVGAISTNNALRLTVQPAVDVAVAAELVGPLSAVAGSILTRVTTVSGLAAIVNDQDAVVGRLRETNAELRRRHLDTLAASGSNTAKAVRSRVLELDGVQSCRVVENRTPYYDSDGRPPHSFEAYVVGGDPDEIRAAIFAVAPAGIQPYGTEAGSVIDEQGEAQLVAFSRPTSLYLWVRVTITPGEGYPSIGDPLSTAAAALLAYLTGAGAPVQGSDLYRFGLHAPLAAAIPGIASVLVELDTTAAPDDVPTYADADVAVAGDELLIVDAARISVLEV